jgi:hypothetical protein
MKGNERPLIIHQVNSVYLPRRMDVSPQIRRATLQKLTFTFRTFNTLDPYQSPLVYLPFSDVFHCSLQQINFYSKFLKSKIEISLTQNVKSYNFRYVTVIC